MNKKMLKKLFRGELMPLENHHIQTQQIEELNRKISELRNYFYVHFAEDEKVRLELYIDMLLNRSSLESEELQFEAFVLGIQMGLEIREETANSIKF
ncbi:MAG: hypothetical protein R3Y54_09030 [Eubacteriales bacterium]